PVVRFSCRAEIAQSGGCPPSTSACHQRSVHFSVAVDVTVLDRNPSTHRLLGRDPHGGGSRHNLEELWYSPRRPTSGVDLQGSTTWRTAVGVDFLPSPSPSPAGPTRCSPTSSVSTNRGSPAAIFSAP